MTAQTKTGDRPKIEIPQGIPSLGLLPDEVEEYVRAYEEFRENILSGGYLYGTYHCWRAVGTFEDRNQGGIRVLVHEDAADGGLEAREKEAVRRFQQTGEMPASGEFFVIDAAFVAKAWTIGVHRLGFQGFIEGEDGDMDRALQIARWGCQQQG